jgi:hypothetical protein
VIGMLATNGVASAFQPLAGGRDTERLRLEAIARDGLQPRIMGLETRAVSIASGGVRRHLWPKSPAPPNRTASRVSIGSGPAAPGVSSSPATREARVYLYRFPWPKQMTVAFGISRAKVRGTSADFLPAPKLPRRQED